MRRRIVGLVRTGLLATLAAMATTTATAALAQAVGVVFEVPDGGETIPLSGIAFVTGVFSVVGIVIAAALLRWSSHPREHFVRTTVALTAVSLVPPWLVGAAASTSVALVVLHLAAAALVIPAVAGACGRRAPSPRGSALGEPESLLGEVADLAVSGPKADDDLTTPVSRTARSRPARAGGARTPRR